MPCLEINATYNFFVASDSTKTFTQFNWQYQTGAAIRGTPVCNSKLVFIGSSDRNLYALNKTDGKLIWKYDCSSAITSSPAYSRGVIDVSTLSQHLLAIDATKGISIYTKTIGTNPVYDWDFDYYSNVYFLQHYLVRYSQKKNN